MVRSPFIRSVVHGILTAFLVMAASIYLAIAEAWTWRSAHIEYSLLILVMFILFLNAFVETARGLWRGVICALLFAGPIILACCALSWYFWQDTQAHLRVELRFVAAVTGGLSMVLIPLVLRLRQNKNHDG
jgi:hypothetical protein